MSWVCVPAYSSINASPAHLSLIVSQLSWRFLPESHCFLSYLTIPVSPRIENVKTVDLALFDVFKFFSPVWPMQHLFHLKNQCWEPEVVYNVNTFDFRHWLVDFNKNRYIINGLVLLLTLKRQNSWKTLCTKLVYTGDESPTLRTKQPENAHCPQYMLPAMQALHATSQFCCLSQLFSCFVLCLVIPSLKDSFAIDIDISTQNYIKEFSFKECSKRYGENSIPFQS